MFPIEEYIVRLEEQLGASSTIRIADADFTRLSPEDLIRVKNHFGGHTLLRLPEREVAFFEWLKREDRAVWDDLWAAEEEPYVVSIDFIEQCGPEGNGFPICDLCETDNYFFTDRHIKIPDGITALQETIQKITRHETISPGEALLYEAYCGPIDIWHFAHRHRIPLAAAKRVVAELVEAGLLVHLTARDDLVDYIEF